MRAPAEVGRDAVREGDLGSLNGRTGRSSRALDERRRPRQSEAELLPPRQRSLRDDAQPAIGVDEGELVVGRAAGRLDCDAGKQRDALADEPVLLEREAMARGEGIGEDVVREGSHARDGTPPR